MFFHPIPGKFFTLVLDDLWVNLIALSDNIITTYNVYTYNVYIYYVAAN